MIPVMSVMSGIIENWGIDFMSEDYNKCISGEIYESDQFAEGKLIYTSIIDNIFIEHNYLSKEIGVNPLINIHTIHNSRYILGKISSQFKTYLEFIIKQNKLCEDTYSLDTSQGIINSIKWYLKNNNN
jgi:hypothetical protein